MLRSEFATLVRTYTSTNSTTFTDAEILALMNPLMGKQAMVIKDANEDLFGGLATRDLVADTREYGLPNDLLSTIERVEAKLDGTNWQVLSELELPLEEFTTDESAVRSAFSGRKPAYDIFRRSLFLYTEDAILDVTAGLKLWGFFWPTALANLTDVLDLAAPAGDTSF